MTRKRAQIYTVRHLSHYTNSLHLRKNLYPCSVVTCITSNDMNISKRLILNSVNESICVRNNSDYNENEIFSRKFQVNKTCAKESQVSSHYKSMFVTLKGISPKSSFKNGPNWKYCHLKFRIQFSLGVGEHFVTEIVCFHIVKTLKPILTFCKFV